MSFNATPSHVEFLTWHSIGKLRSMKGNITSYTKRRLKNLKKLLRSYPNLESLEILHEIRIEIKKIKTVLRLLHYNKKSFRSHKAYLPFRAIFRACGVIREPFVNQSLIDKFKGNPRLTPNGSLDPTLNFRNNLSIYIRTIKRSETKILPKTEKIKNKTYKDFLKKKKAELENLLYPTFLQGDLHKIRKLIKEIYYLTSIRSKRKDINTFFVTSSDLIGNWHDKTIVIQKLRKSVPPETELIQKLKTESRSDIRVLKKLVHNFYK